jgi:sugar-specific transcriptional regulator TrmB
MENAKKILSVLKNFGLEAEEAKTYLTMLNMGHTTVLEIARRTGIKRCTVYLIINRLIKKELVKEATIGKKKYYQVENPKKLIKLLDKKKHELEENLPLLRNHYRQRADTPNLFFYEGRVGVEKIFEEIVATEGRDEILWFGCPQNLFDECYKIYKTVERNIIHNPPAVRLLTNSKLRDRTFAKSLNDDQKVYKKVQARILPKKLLFPNTNNIIFDNKLVIFSLSVDYFAIVIESADVANTYRALFETAWESAAKVENR